MHYGAQARSHVDLSGLSTEYGGVAERSSTVASQRSTLEVKKDDATGDVPPGPCSRLTAPRCLRAPAGGPRRTGRAWQSARRGMTTLRAAGDDTATGDRVKNEKAPAIDDEERVKKLESVVKRQRQVVRDQQTSITASILKSPQHSEVIS